MICKVCGSEFNEENFDMCPYCLTPVSSICSEGENVDTISNNEIKNENQICLEEQVDSISTDEMPYNDFEVSEEDLIEENEEVIQGFTNALQKGMDYVNTHTPEEIAKIIQPQFKETDLDTIITIITRYYEQDTWKKDLVFEEESFELLQDILESAGELEKRAPYEDLVTTTFAKKAVE